jgi:uncharacterized membrane protein
MDHRHKNRASIGVVVWLAVMLAFVALLILLKNEHEWVVNIVNQNTLIASVVLGFFIQYFFFFWGGNHLAKAKGYSSGMLCFGIFWPAQMVILAILLFALPDKCSSPMRKQKHHHDESPIARIVRCRRNAFMANLLGIAGILVSLALVFLPLGLFDRRDNAGVAAVFIFVPSYVAIIFGCCCWLKAKNWPDAVVFIGLCPLLLLLRRGRMIYLNTGLFLLMMVLMPILLMGVIAVLPDKSGMPKRKHWDQK